MADSDEQSLKLKSLTEDLRVWKQKVCLLQASIEKETAIRQD